MSLTARLSLILLAISGVPTAVAALLLEYGHHREALNLSIFWLVTLIALLVPLARVIAYLIVGRDIEKINGMCSRMRQGDYHGTFVLPFEREDEHELIRLKRHMN